MTLALTVNGTQYNYPENRDERWGSQATLWAQAVTSGMLQKAGGTFTLTAEVDFGATYGLKTAYYKTQTSNIATAGQFRLARANVISWRNQANGANLDLGVSSSNILQFNGEDIIAGSIVNADIDAAAAIAFSKMAALTVSRALVSDGSGVVSVASTTSTQIGYLSTTTSDVQVQLAARLPLSGGTLTGALTLSGDPASALQAATKQYVDSVAVGLQPKTACRVATTTAGTLASDFENGDTVDGTVLATNDRILIKNQAAQAENGIYTVNASGAPTRGTDADTWAELVGASVFITAGTANAATGWVCNVAAGGTLGVTSVTFVQNLANTAYTASGSGIELSGNQFSLELDGTTLSVGGSGLKVADGGIANTQVNASAAIAMSKLAALTASRALVSDGSGFVSASSVTATTLGYLDATSSVQTQIDAKIAKTLTSSRGDMIYASAANTPARLAVGTSGYIIQSDGTDPVWTDQKISTTYFVSDASTYAIQTTFTALTLVAVTDYLGSPCVRSANTITFAYTGKHEITGYFSNLSGGGGRTVLIRLRNTTDGTTLDQSCLLPAPSDHVPGIFFLRGNVSDIAKVYEIQFCANGSGVSFDTATVGGVASHLYQIKIDRPRQ